MTQKTVTREELNQFYKGRYTEYGRRWKKKKEIKIEIKKPKLRADIDGDGFTHEE